MPHGDIAIVFDCGATNVRVIAIDGKGDILASIELESAHIQMLVWQVKAP